LLRNFKLAVLSRIRDSGYVYLVQPGTSGKVPPSTRTRFWSLVLVLLVVLCALFRAPSQLNGANGEVTMDDDMPPKRDREMKAGPPMHHQDPKPPPNAAKGPPDKPRRAKMINAGSKRRGGGPGDFGPPSDDETIDSVLARMKQVDPTDLNASIENVDHDNRKVQGDVKGLITNISQLALDTTRRAGVNMGTYTNAKFETQHATLPLTLDRTRAMRVIEIEAVERNDGTRAGFNRDNMTHAGAISEQADNRQFGHKTRITDQECANKRLVIADESAARLALSQQEAAQRDASSTLQHDLRVIAKRDELIAKAAGQNHVDLWYRDEAHRADVEEVATLAALAALARPTDPRIIAAQDAELATRHAFQRRNHHILMDMASLAHDVSEVALNGKAASKLIEEAIDWRSLKKVRTDWMAGEEPVYDRNDIFLPAVFDAPVGTARYNPKFCADPIYQERVMFVPLVVGLLYEKRGPTTILEWFAGGFLTFWKRTVDVEPRGSMASDYWGSTRWVPGHLGRKHLSKDLMGLSTLYSNQARQRARSILQDYRFLGMEFSIFRDLLDSAGSFIRANDFTHTREVLVHPTLYQTILANCLGQQMTHTAILQIKRQYKNPWGQYIQSGLFTHTIDLACQHIAALNYLSSLSAPKVKNNLGDL